MRRYILYVMVALLAFGAGSFVAFQFYRTAEKTPTIKEEMKISTENKSKTDSGTGFGTASAIRRADEPVSVYEPKLHKPTCGDKRLLPLWNELRKDKEFKDREGEFYQTGDCTELLEIDRMDLNGDGQKEFIVWGRYPFSGATGNRVVWIYERKNGKYRKLLQSYAYNDGAEKWFEVKKAESNGYRNILLKGHFTGYETTHSFYKFNGRRYIETKCWFEIYSINEEKPTTMTCREYSEETERQLRESEKRLKKQ